MAYTSVGLGLFVGSSQCKSNLQNLHIAHAAMKYMTWFEPLSYS